MGGKDPTALLPANAITHTAVEFMCGAGGHAFGMRKVLNIIGAAESCGHMRASYEASLGVRPKRTVKALASGGLVASVVLAGFSCILVARCGAKRGLADADSTEAFADMCSYVKRNRVMGFLGENVLDLGSQDDGE